LTTSIEHLKISLRARLDARSGGEGKEAPMRAAAFGFLVSLTALGAAGAPPASAQTSNVTLKVATFGGHSGEVEKSYVGDRMTRVTGVKIEWTHGNPSDFFAKMVAARGRQPPFDVVLLDDAVQNAAIKAGVLARLDPALVPNLKNLYPRARNPQGYGPYAILYSIGIVYNKDRLKAAGVAEPASWMDLFDPRLAGHVSIPDMSLPQGADFVMKMAQLNGGSEADVLPGLKRIAEIKASSYYTSSATLGEQLAAGDAWMSVWTSGRAWAMIKQGYPVGYVIPKEGSILGIDTVDMVAGTAHPREAQQFIDMQLDALGQLGWAVEMSYGPSNAALQSVFAAYPELARTMPSSEADLARLYSPDWGVYNANLARATDYWNRNVKH
jgi:putative spermidine/putrescine transport system substrate-binding protein